MARWDRSPLPVHVVCKHGGVSGEGQRTRGGVWPALPAGRGLVRLPVELPPMLTRAIGYSGGGRYLELHWTADQQRIDWFDGQVGVSGDATAWQTFSLHPRVRPLLVPYEQGDGCYALLADHWERSLSVGTSDHVSSLLGSQPSELRAVADMFGGSDDAVLDVLQAMLERGRPADECDRRRRSAARALLGDAVGRWLDDLPNNAEV